MHEQNITYSQTKLGNIAHEQTIIYRQLFAGHVVGFRPIKRKKNVQQLIIQCVMCMLEVEKCRLISNKLLLDKAEYSFDK